MKINCCGLAMGIIAVGSLAATGCSELEEALEDNTSVSWSFEDACEDGSAMNVNFHERRQGQPTGFAWPGSNRVYEFSGTQEFDLACEPDTTICFGAEPDSRNGFYWGISLSGDRGCEDCCRSCGASGRSIALRC